MRSAGAADRSASRPKTARIPEHGAQPSQAGACGSGWIPEPPGSYKLRPGVAVTDLTREQKLELYRYMRLNRVVEERLVNLYRQGKVVGGLYRSLGQEATSVGSAYALRKGDIVGPLIRNLGVVLVMGYTPRDVMTQYMARGDVAFRRPRLQPALRTARARRDLPDLHARRPRPGDGRDRPRRADAEEGPRRHDLDRRRRHVHGGLPRGHQLRGGPETAARHRGREQRLGLLDAVQEADRAKNLADKAIAYGIPGEQVDGNDVLAVHGVGAPRRGPRAFGGRPHADRVAHLPHEGTRRARRPGVRAEGGARGVAPAGPPRSVFTRARGIRRRDRARTSPRSTGPSPRKSTARSRRPRRARCPRPRMR